MHYSFLPYDSVFPKLFEKEKSHLQQILGNDFVIEHFGSTSVSGLGGKGVVDIYVLTLKEKVKIVSKTLQENKYVFSDFFKDEDHLLHQIDREHEGRKYHYHIHVSSMENINFKNCIIFRDFLRTHPEAVGEYIQLKHLALEKIKNITDKKERVQIYLKTKGSIIEKIIQQSKK